MVIKVFDVIVAEGEPSELALYTSLVLVALKGVSEKEEMKKEERDRKLAELALKLNLKEMMKQEMDGKDEDEKEGGSK